MDPRKPYRRGMIASPQMENVGFQFPALYQPRFTNHSPFRPSAAENPSICAVFGRKPVCWVRAKPAESLSGERRFSKPVYYAI